MRRRLLMLRETDDGFTIADEDFRIRGGGDLLGRQQSGLVGFRLSDPAVHERLLAIAVKDAAWLLNRDAGLVGLRGQAVVRLLRLFGRDETPQVLAAG